MKFFQLLGGLVPLVGLVAGHPTCNHECNRGCWSNGFDVLSDWESKWPITGKTNIYELEITEVDEWVGPDGVVKHGAMLINGGFPGPVLRGNWGDRFDVIVTNKLKYNGTSMHWHGLHLWNNNINDGVAGITECPIPPGASKKYTFIATQYGSSWYHSHISSQYANGIVGAIQIDGPASYPYDQDLGVFPINDWYYDSVETILQRMMDPNNPYRPGSPGSPPESDNILFNGTNINPNGPGGEYAKVRLTSGKRHRLRLINPSADNTFTISIVGHTMTVIEADFVPVQPYDTTEVYLGVGQRYDVVINADQPAGAYWLNATLSSNGFCGSSKNPYPAAIVTYEGFEDSIPTDPGVAPVDTYCADDLSLRSLVPMSAPKTEFNPRPEDTLSVSLEVNTNISKVFWEVNGVPIDVSWEKPTLQYVLDSDLSFPLEANVIQLPDETVWTFWVIQNVSPIPHPMHLHGHDFLVLGRSELLPDPTQGSGPVFFDPAVDTEKLTFDNPTRRDTTMLPGFGWLVIAFKAGNNPGAWSFHCHIPWHMSQGLSVKFLERPDIMASKMDLPSIGENCNAWREYAPTNPFQKFDSGL
ncbi:laccase [Naviculisporaceae sp. PSN 640]